jgi:hypothetical protein
MIIFIEVQTDRVKHIGVRSKTLELLLSVQGGLEPTVKKDILANPQWPSWKRAFGKERFLATYKHLTYTINTSPGARLQ